MLLFSKKTWAILAILALACSGSTAQTADQKLNIGGFKNEIDLHFTVPGLRYDFGASLLFKKQFGETVQKKWLQKDAYRVSTGYGFEKIEEEYSYDIGSAVITEISDGKRRTFTAHIGYEKQFKKGRFEHWFAVEMGGRVTRSASLVTHKRVDGGQPVPDRTFDHKGKSISLGMVPIWGFRAFLSLRFSAGLEFGFPAEWGLETTEVKTINGTSATTNIIGMYGKNAPRFLFVGYHF